MMAERTVVSRAWCLPIPDAVDDVRAAALPNPVIEIGEMAGPTIALPAAALRSSGIEIYGSGERAEASGRAGRGLIRCTISDTLSAMRPLRYSINVTLDGCRDHRAVTPDDELHRHAVENLAQADALLFGRVTYEMMEAAFRPPAPPGLICALVTAGTFGWLWPK
jgi:hypothetical protein